MSLKPKFAKYHCELLPDNANTMDDLSGFKSLLRQSEIEFANGIVRKTDFMKFENDYGRTTRGRTQNSNISCQLENAPLSRQINSEKRTWVAEEDPFLGLRVDVVTVAEQTQGVDV